MSKIGEVGIARMFPEREFTGLTFNVTKAKDGVFNKFPELKSLRSWKKYERADADKVMKYIVLLFDPGTPLRKERNPENRRHIAAILSGWDPRDKGYAVALAFENEDHLEMIADYLIYVNNRDWTMLVVAEMIFIRYVKMGLTGAFNVVKDIPEQMEEISKKLDTYYDKMFKDKDVATKIRKGRISAEAIAKHTSGVQED